MRNTIPTSRAAADASVNGLRGIALLLIVLTHYVPSSFFSGNIARPVAATMMVVTGYYFAMILERQGLDADLTIGARLGLVIGAFFQRHARIWPAVAGIIGIYVILGFIVGDRLTTQIHHTWPLYLAYMGNVVKMIYESEAFPAHFWLISAQEQFVLITLMAIIVVGYRGLQPFLVIAVVLGVGARFIGALIWMPDHPALATESPLAVADALALGMLCRRALAAGVSRTRLRRGLTAAMLGVGMFWAVMPNTFAFYFALVPFVTALVGCLVIVQVTDNVRSRRFEAAMLSWPFLVVIGQMSLSLFLVHPLINTILNLSYSYFTGRKIHWLLLMLVGPPLSLAAAFCYFRMVEVPLRRMRRRLRKPVGVPQTI